MKIEMGESLFYSWLKHVKECQIVQTNWKASSQWTLQNETRLEELKQIVDEHFESAYGYDIFKNSASLSQIIQQGECDAIGISLANGQYSLYAVDVAFHGAGLNYGSKETTIAKVIAKTTRTAMCLYGFLGSNHAEIIFASPKINPAIVEGLLPCLDDLRDIFARLEFGFSIRLIANDDFNTAIMRPILIASEGIADTAELFVRSYQMFTMFTDGSMLTPSQEDVSQRTPKHRRVPARRTPDFEDMTVYRELKVGTLAKTVLRRMLEEGAASDEEIERMQREGYSKKVFDLNFPLLVREDADYDKRRYYVQPLMIHGVRYLLCSQWYEVPANNDRPFLLKWIEEHESDA